MLPMVAHRRRVPIPTANLLAWYRPTANRITLNGSNVAALADSFGANHVAQGTAGNQPAYTASNPRFNGHPSIDFDAASAEYLFGSSLPLCTSLSGSDVPMTIAAVVLRETKLTDTEQMLFSLGNSALAASGYVSGSWHDMSNDRQIVRMRLRENAAVVSESSPRENTRKLTGIEPQILAFRLSGTVARAHVVGSTHNPFYDAVTDVFQVSPDYSAQGAFTFDRFSIGNFLRSTATLPGTFSLAEMAVYAAELDDATLLRLVQYWWNRYISANAAELPASLLIADHEWDADAVDESFGETCARLYDGVGGKHFDQNTEASRPLVVDAGNGRKALRFSPGKLMTAGVAADWTKLHNGSDLTVVVAYRVAEGADAFHPILDTLDNDPTNRSGFGLYHDGASGSHAVQFKAGATNATPLLNQATQNYGAKPGEWHVAIVTHESAVPTIDEHYRCTVDNETFAAADNGVTPAVAAPSYPLALGALASSPPAVPYWADGVSIGNRPTSTNWQENSGVARSRLAANGIGDAGHLWHISDSPANRFMAQRISDGAGRGEWTLTGASTSDWEDIASATIGGVDYLYIADIGDNANARSTVTIFRVVEPTITGSDSSTASYEAIACQYPAGDLPSHKDAETIFVDPDSGDVYIVTKRITPAKLYRLPHQVSYTGTQTLEFVGDIWTGPFTDDATGPSTGGYYVGGAINDDGTLIVLKNYQDVFVFPRDKATQTIFQALSQPGVVVEGYVGGERPSSHPNNEPKGEGICFLADDDLITTSEYNATYGSSASAYPTFRYAKLSQAPTQVSFQEGVDGYAGTSDTYIWSKAANQGDDHGSDVTFVADYNSGTDERYGLLKFDLSTIPAGATIVGCDLYLNINTEGQFFELYRMFQAWDESSSYTSLGGLPAFDDVVAASVPDARHGNYDTISGTGVIVQVKIPVATIQNWIDGTLANNGWVIYGTTNADGLQFASSENATTSDRPRLVVRYTLPNVAVDVGYVAILNRSIGKATELRQYSEFVAALFGAEHQIVVGGNGLAGLINDAAPHRAFPGFVIDSRDVRHVIYRRGANHGASRGVGCQVSSGDGYRWSREKVIYDIDDADGRDFRAECGGVCLALGDHAGRLLLSSKWSADDSNINVAGVPSTLLIGTSDDDGGSWSWADPLAGKTAFLATLDYTASPNSLIELRGGPFPGRVLFVFTTSETGEGTGDQDIRLVHSDDAGQTWSDPIVVLHRDAVAWRATEQHVVEFGDGYLLMLIRDDTNHFIYSMDSTDGGLTWGNLTQRFAGWGRPMATLDENERLYCFYRSDSDNKAKWRSSDDRGVTWSAERALANLQTTTGLDNYPTMSYVVAQHNAAGDIELAVGLEDSPGGDADVFFRRWRSRKPTKAVHLVQASGQYLSRAHDEAWNLAGATGFTAAGWLYRDSTGAAYIAGKYAAAGTREWALYLTASGYLAARLSADGTTATVFTSTLSVSNAGRWYFVALRYDPNDPNDPLGALILNVDDATKQQVAHAGGLFSGSANVRLGASDISLAESFDGRLDRWGFWRRPLSDAELTALRNGGRGLDYRDLSDSQKSDLIAYYDLGQYTSTRADSSGNGQHLSPVGSPTNAEGVGNAT